MGAVRVACKWSAGFVILDGMSIDPGPASPAARHTRLVATIGPASVGMADQLVEAGLDVARINLSHGSVAEHRQSD